MISLADIRFASLANASAPGTGGQIGTSGLYDLIGGACSINSGTLRNVGTYWGYCAAVLPNTISALNQTSVTYLKAGTTGPVAHLRIKADGSKAYFARFDPTSLEIGVTPLNSQITSSLGLKNISPSFDTSIDYVMTFTATSSFNRQTTTLYATIAPASNPSAYVVAVAATDATSDLQSAGGFGWGAYVGTGSNYKSSRVQAYSNDVPSVNIVWHGDSLTQGYGASNPGTTNTARISTVLNGLTSDVTGTNAGTGGIHMTALVTQLPTVIAPAYVPGKTNILIVQGGTNDLDTGSTAQNVIDSIKTYVATALAANPWLIIFATMTPSTATFVPQDFNIARNTINAWLRSNWRALGIAALSDVAQNGVIGQDANESDATYYQADRLHLTDAGGTIWGQCDLGAVEMVLGSGPVNTGPSKVLILR